MRALLNILNVVYLKHPITAGRKKKVNGRDNTGFMDLANVFSPYQSLDIRKDSVWNPSWRRVTSKEFHETMDELTDRGLVLPDFLVAGKIFGNYNVCLVHCLAPQGRWGRLWEAVQWGCQNVGRTPISYKIEMIGKAKRTPTPRGKQIKASRVIL